MGVSFIPSSFDSQYQNWNKWQSLGESGAGAQKAAQLEETVLA